MAASTQHSIYHVQGRRTNSGISPYQGPWGQAQALHLLRRTLFGVRKPELIGFTALGAAQSVAKLLEAPGSAPEPPVNNYNTGNFTDPTVAPGETWVLAPRLSNGEARRRASWQSWYVGQLLNQKASLIEKMTAFLHTHLVTEATVVGDGRFVYATNALLRSYALGNFKELIKKITLDPGMLVYLNGAQNNKNKPDENYARELQELFTQGKGPGSQYTEDDVKAAARVLTGFQPDPDSIGYKFVPNRHDSGDKQFSSYYGNTLIKGKSGAEGESELDDLINMLFAGDEVSRYIVRRLYNYFVYYEISDAEEENVIAPLAEIFKTSNFEIRPVLEALFTSEHFYDNLNMGCMIKSPYDLAIGTMRQFEVQLAPASEYTALYNQWAQIRAQLTSFQQEPGEPPGVAGYPAYYQAPQFHEIWINSVTLPARQALTTRLFSTGFSAGGYKLKIDPTLFVSMLDDALDPNTLISESAFLLYGVEVSQASMDFMKSILLSGQSSDYYWTNAWQDYLANPDDEGKKNIVLTRLNALYTYMSSEEEYQLS